MSPRLLAQVIAAGRVLTGIVLFVKSDLVTSRWVGEAEAGRTGTRVMAGGLGARDIVVGAGALAALNAGGDAAKPWLIGAVAADALDLVSTLRHAGDLPRSAVAGTVAVAGGAAAAGLYVLTQDL